jgi:hypothetical protein
MVKMWKYFMHIRGEVVSEDYDIGTLNKREMPSRETQKRACLHLIAPTEMGNPELFGIVDTHLKIYEKEFEVKLSQEAAEPHSPDSSYQGSPSP